MPFSPSFSSSSSCRFGLIVCALVLGACGGSPRKPAMAVAAATHEPAIAPPSDTSSNVLHDRRAEPGVRAAVKPLVLGRPASVKCGALTKSAADASSRDLLDGRLKVRAPPGARIPTAAADAPSLAEESRIIVEPGSKKESAKAALAIVARETFQLDPDLYEPEADAPSRPGVLDVEAPKFLQATFGRAEGADGGAPLEVVPVELGSGVTKLRAYAARPRHPNAPPGKDTALVLALLVAQDDGTLESIAFYVRGEMVREATGSDLQGCTRLAERVASTIVPGPRKLERAAGRRRVGGGSPESDLALTVPADYVAIPTNTGAHVYKLRPLSLYAGSISVAIVDEAKSNAEQAGVDTKVAGKLLGRPIEWRGKVTSGKGGFYFASVPLDETAAGGKHQTAEVLVKAMRQVKVLDEMRGVAETLQTKRIHD